MKKLLTIFILLILSTSIFSQRTLIINTGYSVNTDLSVLVGSKFKNNNLYSSVEYSHNLLINKDNELIGLGWINNLYVISAKVGVCHIEEFEPTLIPFLPLNTKHMESHFDYGVEFIWLNENTNNITFCYGVSATHMNGIQIKMGLAF